MDPMIEQLSTHFDECQIKEIGGKAWSRLFLVGIIISFSKYGKNESKLLSNFYFFLAFCFFCWVSEFEPFCPQENYKKHEQRRCSFTWRIKRINSCVNPFSKKRKSRSISPRGTSNYLEYH